jgi:hypothetical protein
MIYDSVDETETIRQGDIFRNLPRVDISLKELAVLASTSEGESVEEMSWEEAIRDSNASEVIGTDTDKETLLIRAILPVCPVDAIVITQDCDAARAVVLSLCEITSLFDMNKGMKTVTSVSKWARELSKGESDSVRYFYLPPDAKYGFTERKAVDFRSIIRLPQPHIDQLKTFRIGRLKTVPYEHFREKIAQFFRRYPYDPWYPLNKEEFEAYAKDYPPGSIKPFEWQG